jgi:hypothetical protein
MRPRRLRRRDDPRPVGAEGGASDLAVVSEAGELLPRRRLPQDRFLPRPLSLRVTLPTIAWPPSFTVT